MKPKPILYIFSFPSPGLGRVSALEVPIAKMRINFKQEELIDELVNILIKKFPEVELIDITESPEDSESLWVNVTAPKDEDKEIELRAFASDKTTDILIDYWYHIFSKATPSPCNDLSVKV